MWATGKKGKCVAKESTGNGVHGKGCGQRAVKPEFMWTNHQSCVQSFFKRGLVYGVMTVLLNVAHISVYLLNKP